MRSSVEFMRRKDVLCRSFDGLLVVAPQSGEPTAFSGSASLVWSLLEKPIRLADLVVTITRSTGASPEVVRLDLEGLLAEFQRIQVVETC